MKRLDVVIFTLVLSLLMVIDIYQARTIESQRHVMEQMMTNPACMVGRVQ